MKFLYNPPAVVKKIFNDFIWKSKGGILFTFDDGPTAHFTETILKKLGDNNIKAVFFCVGNNISLHPGLCRDILSEGHTIGNHTYNHKAISKLGNIELNTELEQLNNLMSEIFNYTVKYFRPPYGKFSLSSSRTVLSKGMDFVMWSLLLYDYHNNLSKVKPAVKKYLRQDSIVVLHDNIKSKDVILPAIDLILETAEIKKYSVESPSKCLS